MWQVDMHSVVLCVRDCLSELLEGSMLQLIPKVKVWLISLDVAGVLETSFLHSEDSTRSCSAKTACAQPKPMGQSCPC